MTVTKLDWLQAVEINSVAKPHIEHFGYLLEQFTKHARTWGEAGTIKLQKVNKVDDYGITCVFVGYANIHKGIGY